MSIHRTTITIALTIDTAPGVDPKVALDDMLVAAERAMRLHAGDDLAHRVTRIRLDADIDEATTTTL
jgi:hypothetical protein